MNGGELLELEDLRAKVATAADEALEVFAMIGQLTAEASRARVAAEAARAAAERAEAAVRRVEAIATRIEAATAEAGRARVEALARRVEAEEHSHARRLESLAEVGAEDDTQVRELKIQVSAIAERHANELAVSAADTRRLKTLAGFLGFVVVVAAVAGIVWAIFTYAVRATGR